MINREDIAAALWVRLSAIPGLATKSRRLKHWNDVPARMRPALFMAQRGQVAATQTGQPTIWRLSFDVYIYVHTPEPQVPASALNAILDGVAGALAPDAGISGRCTLDGLVHYARIEGGIETDEGTLGDTAVAIVPIEILTTD